MKRITACFLSVLFLCSALVPMAVHADAMDQKLQEELGSINFWYEACFDEEVELTYCKWLANEITWEFWDGLADEDDYYIDLSSRDVLEYLTWRCGENTGSLLFDSVKEGVEDSGFEYDEETDTFRFYSGGFGGFRYNREYRGYVKYGNWYRVFYADTVQVDLYDLYYNGQITEEEYENAISTGVFEGHEVLSSMGDYYYVAEVKKSGIRYHVQFAADGHAIIDIPQYVGESEFPDEFDQEGELDHDGVFITKHPQSIEVLEDGFAIFTVEADCEIVEYKWYYKASDATKYSLHSHTDDPQFCVDMIPERDGWQVYCVVTDVHGCTAKSEIATATMVKRGDFANQLADDVSGLNFWAEHHPTASVENLYYNFMKEDIFLHCPGTMDDEGYVHVDATDAYNRIYQRAEEELAAEVWSAFLENRVNGIRFDEENREFVGIPAAFGGGIPNRVYRGFNGAGEEDTWRVYYADCETVILEDLLYYGEITQNEYDAAVKNGVYNGYPLEENDFHYFVKDVLDSGIYYTVKYQNGQTILSLPRYYDETLTPYFEHEGVKIT
ncbi:MAG: hypothetical protein IJF24_00090, partial [Clostridia bacterium]|nr:hypothetical protein [Clostridia bacterium]